MERGGPELPAAAAPQIETDDQTALVSKPRNKGGNSNLASAGFNIINSIIGSGIIGLPYSMKEAGFPLGVLLLFGVAYITERNCSYRSIDYKLSESQMRNRRGLATVCQDIYSKIIPLYY